MGAYLGIVSSRYTSCEIYAKEDIEKEEQSIAGTDYKTSTQILFTNAMEIFWSSVRQKAWTMFHPPPTC